MYKMHDKNSNKFYRKVPKVTTLVTFGFSTLYYTAITTFGVPVPKVSVLKRVDCTPRWVLQKIKSQKNVKGILFEKKR